LFEIVVDKYLIYDQLLRVDQKLDLIRMCGVNLKQFLIKNTGFF